MIQAVDFVTTSLKLRARVPPNLALCSNDCDLHSLTSRRRCCPFESTSFQILERHNVVIEGIVPIAELIHIPDQVLHNAPDTVVGMKAEHISCLFEADLVVPNVVEVVDIEFDAPIELLFDFG